MLHTFPHHILVWNMGNMGSMRPLGRAPPFNSGGTTPMLARHRRRGAPTPRTRRRRPCFARNTGVFFAQNMQNMQSMAGHRTGFGYPRRRTVVYACQRPSMSDPPGPDRLPVPMVRHTLHQILVVSMKSMVSMDAPAGPGRPLAGPRGPERPQSGGEVAERSQPRPGNRGDGPRSPRGTARSAGRAACPAGEGPC
jgi:hypothetical protein